MCRYLTAAVILVLLAACSPESGTQALSENEAPPVPAVASDELPPDILEGSRARVPLLRRETLDADGTIKTFDIQQPPGRELLLPDLW